ncbi:MAG: hypothetical protein LBP63_11045 [Prevotellaceae bacterium]|jgi:hypothetical protein|nr:hypothetical protein [Prevotellaceae bacterium]
MDDVKKWIESDAPDYITGVALFSKYNRNRAIAQWLGRVGEKRGMSKLRYEMEKLALHIPKPKTGKKPELQIEKKQWPTYNIPPIKPERLIIDVEGKIKFEDLPDELQPLYLQIVEKYRIMRSAHQAMIASKSTQERSEFYLMLREFDDIISKNWAIIDNWYINSELPNSPTNEDAGGGCSLTPQQVNAFRTYISRSVAEPDKIDDERRKTIQQRITAMIDNNQSFDEQTIEKLKTLGFNTEPNIPAQN